MSNPTSEPLVFPVGHYMGAFYPGAGQALRYRKVRIGVDVAQIVGDERFGVWALAHGLPDRLDKGPWTRSALLAAATEAELPDAETHLDALLEQKVLTQVAPGTPESIEFAKTHRLQPLMMGLGNSPQDPLSFGLGFVGAPPVVRVPSFLYELWQWGRIGRSLWHTVEMFAKVEREVAQKGAGVPDPQAVLDRILSQLHVLLAHNAAYLDQTLPAPSAG